MGLFKNLFDKAKEKANEIKSNVSKQDLLDLVTDVQKTIAEGGINNDVAKGKAAGQLLKGLGQMATGTYKGASRKLEEIHKDPHDIMMAEDTKADLNAILVDMLNPRKFIYEAPDKISELGIFMVESMPFINIVNDKTMLPKIHAHFKDNGVHYDEQLLEKTVNDFIRSKEATQLLAIRHQVDKYVFIDRMSKAEIVSLYENYNQNIKTHYKYQCEYCRRKFVSRPHAGAICSLSIPMNSGLPAKPHKVHTIDED